MNKKYIIKKNEEISNIVKTSNKLTNRFYVVYYKENKLGFNRFCVSVGKKIGNAVERNLYKRRIKDILMKNKLNNSFDYVIILRTAILEITYNDMRDELINLLKGDNK